MFIKIKPSNGSKIKVDLPIKIEPKHWDAEGQVVRRSFTSHEKLSTLLDNIQQFAKYLSDQMALGNEYTGPELRKLIRNKLNGKNLIQESNHHNYSGWFDNLWEEYLNTYMLNRAAGTKKNYRGTKTVLLDYKKNIQPSDMTMKFFSGFVAWRYEKGKSNNTVDKDIQHIHNVLKFFEKRDVIIDQDIYDFIKGEPFSPKPMYLDWDSEFQKLLNVTPANSTEQIVLHSFIFRCYTGIRLGSASKVSGSFVKKTVDKVSLAPINMKKGRLGNNIPLVKEAMAILKKYKNYEIPNLPQQTHNKVIKTLAQKAKIEEPFLRTRMIGREVISKALPKHRLISTHTARRTFAKKWHDEGGDLYLLSKVLDHKDIGTTLKYIGVEDFEIESAMIEVFKAD